jgi:hypothetical protein
VEIRLFCAGCNSRAELGSWYDASVEDGMARMTRDNESIQNILVSPAVRVQPGRPDVEGIMRDKIACATGDISVNGMIGYNINEMFFNNNLSLWG